MKTFHIHLLNIYNHRQNICLTKQSPVSMWNSDQVYSSTWVPTQVNTNQHKSDKSQHKSTWVWHLSTPISTSSTWANMSPTQVNTSPTQVQHESKRIQHVPVRVQHESTRIDISPTRVHTSQLDHEIIIAYRSLVGKV